MTLQDRKDALVQQIINDELWPQRDGFAGSYIEFEGDQTVHLDGIFHLAELQAIVALLAQEQPYNRERSNDLDS